MLYTVHVGIGRVLNLRFNPLSNAIIWDPPPTVGELSDLTYYLTVTNMNTGVVDINTNTTDNSYTFDFAQSCTLYKFSVTAFSQDQSGKTENTVEKIPGSECDVYYVILCEVFKFTTYMCMCILLEYYDLVDLLKDVVIDNSSDISPVITVIFKVVLKVMMLVLYSIYVTFYAKGPCARISDFQ